MDVPSHHYNGCALFLSANARSCHLNDIVSVVVHPHTHFTFVTTSHGKFCCVILNGETIDLVSMKYNYFFSTTSSLSTLHYYSLITQRVTSLFLDVVDTTRGKGIVLAFLLLLTVLFPLNALLPLFLPLIASQLSHCPSTPIHPMFLLRLFLQSSLFFIKNIPLLLVTLSP